MKKLKSPSPTMPTKAENYYQEPINKAQIAFSATSGSNAYFSDYYIQNSLKTNIAKNLPSKSTPNNDFSECYTQKEEDKKDTFNKKEHSDNNEVLDLMKFSHKENEIIKVIFENGAVKKGDRLLQKSIVKKEFSDNRLITRKDIDNCYDKLADMGFIYFKGGYRALVNIENVITNKK